MPQIKPKINTDESKIRTITTESANKKSDTAFFPAGMQPFEVAEYLNTDIAYGLNRKQVKKRQARTGPNIIQNEFRLSFLQSLKNQISGLLSPLLVVSTLIMFAFDRQYSYLGLAAAITLVFFINAIMESRASRALNVPRKYSSIKTRITREGITDIADSRKLVPGDIILLSEGMVIPCDARLIDDKKLAVLETPISGNPVSVIKDSRYIAGNDSELVYPNMVYAGSIITGGEANAIVCYTGKNTLLRRISGKNSEYQPTLLKYIQKAVKYISVTTIICCFLLLLLGVIRERDIVAIYIISLSAGAVSLCDSMMSFASASLGYGLKRMAKYGSVIKNLNCINNLCYINTVMCDNNMAFPPKKMTVSGIYADNKYNDATQKLTDSNRELLYLSLACSDLKISEIKKRNRKSSDFSGKIYDIAIAEYLADKGYSVSKELDEFFKIETEYSLTGEVSRVLVLYKGENTVILKGAPENVLSRCVGYELNGAGYRMSHITRKRILAALEESTMDSGYVIAVAAGRTAADNLRDITAERKLMFLGFITMFSSLDVDNASAVYRCTQAGIEAVVLSSESFYTAFNTAKNAGIVTDESQVVTAEQMRSTDPGLFIANCPDYKLFLNFSDSEWMQVLRYRKADNRSVGVTVDNINGLSLMNQADVSFVPDGSPDMLKQSADVLMLSKGFDVLADCLQNARLIFMRIHSVVEYLTVGACILFLSAMFAVLFGLVIPFRVQEILFGGIIFNFLFAASLAFSPNKRKLLMEKMPKYKHKPSLVDFLNPLIYSVGASVCILFIYQLTQNYSATLVGYTFLLFLYALTNISRTSIFFKKTIGNLPLILTALFAASVMVLLFLTSPVKELFDYSFLSFSQAGISFVISGGYFILLQLAKLQFDIKNSRRKYD